MKKLIALLLAMAMILACAGCGSEEKETEAPATEAASEEATEADTEEATEADTEEATEADTEEATEAAGEVAVMTYEEYMAAELDSPVCVETYVQANQSWWDGQITLYTQDENGAYFIYNCACESQEEADKLVAGTKIRVNGFKSEWSGEVEIVDGTYEIIDGSFTAEALDVTDLLGTDDLIAHQNEFVSFKGMTVEASTDADGNEVAFLYNWDGSGEEGNDLYFNVSKDGQTYNFVVESYLTGSGTDVYEAVKGLAIGDVIDMEGFLYWYEGANPHIISVAAAQ